jgi:hypothetical protein
MQSESAVMNDTSKSPPAEAKPAYGTARPKVQPFARYKGTSAWKKDRRRVRAYALFIAAQAAANHA